jgi:hypothetical protein
MLTFALTTAFPLYPFEVNLPAIIEIVFPESTYELAPGAACVIDPLRAFSIPVIKLALIVAWFELRLDEDIA